MEVAIIIVLALALAGIAYAYACSTESLRFRKQMFDELHDAFDLRITLLHQYQNILDNANEGIGKRIAEFRYLAATIALQAPEVLRESPRVLDAIRTTDHFLVQLQRAPGFYRPHFARVVEELPHPQRTRHASPEQQEPGGP